MNKNPSCPCGSKLPLSGCCGPFLTGVRFAQTAEALMRSRYSAYALGNPSYILNTTIAERRQQYLEDEVHEWAFGNVWEKLEVLDVVDGGENENEGVVEFQAFYRDAKGHSHTHHERSRFVKKGGLWLYVEPLLLPKPRKVGRNTPCPCGSGKKYKKCCGA